MAVSLQHANAGVRARPLPQCSGASCSSQFLQPASPITVALVLLACADVPLNIIMAFARMRALLEVRDRPREPLEPYTAPSHDCQQPRITVGTLAELSATGLGHRRVLVGWCVITPAADVFHACGRSRSCSEGSG